MEGLPEEVKPKMHPEKQGFVWTDGGHEGTQSLGLPADRHTK